MILIEKTQVMGLEPTIRGMRNPMNSWAKSDTTFYDDGEYHDICGNSGPANAPDDCDMIMGANDLDLLNYEVLANIYQHRRNHKLDEWREVCRWIEGLSYSEIITCNVGKEERN